MSKCHQHDTIRMEFAPESKQKTTYVSYRNESNDVCAYMLLLKNRQNKALVFSTGNLA
jgi:hypothetical protein